VRSAEQVAANVRAGDWNLTADDLTAIESLLAPPDAQPE